MPTVSLTGKDTINIAGRILNDLGDGDVATLTFPNELVKMKVGKNGNTLYAFDESGKQCDSEIRVIRGAADDKFLQSKLDSMERDRAGFVLITGEFVKRVGDGKGNITRDIYTLSGGVFVKRVDAKDNAEGDTEQSIAKYSLKFANAPRSLA